MKSIIYFPLTRDIFYAYDFAMNSIERAIARLRAYREANHVSKHKLARMAGLGKNTLAGLDDPEWRPAISTIEAVERIVPETFTVPDA